jgi:hypothetical protein
MSKGISETQLTITVTSSEAPPLRTAENNKTSSSRVRGTWLWVGYIVFIVCLG